MGDTTPRTALLGFAIPAMEALQKAGRPFVAVVPPGFEGYMEEHGIAYETWDFSRLNEQSDQLAQRLATRGVELAVPLFEECVEWAGALNGRNVHKNVRAAFIRFDEAKALLVVEPLNRSTLTIGHKSVSPVSPSWRLSWIRNA